MTAIDADFTEFKAPAHLEAIRQDHEAFLTQLEALAVLALASGNWASVYDLISEVETWQGEQALLEEKNRVEDPFKDLWNLAFPHETNG